MTRRRRNVLIGLGAVMALLVAGVALGLPALRRRVQTAIEARCGAMVAGSCQVAAVQLAGDGAIATGVQVRNQLTGASAEVGRMAVRFAWWPLLTGREQGLAVRAANVVVRSDTPLEDLAREIARIREARRASRRLRRLRLDSLVVEHVSARARLGLVIHSQLDDASLDWARAGGFRAHWSDATLEAGPLVAGHTGRCSLRREQGARDVVLDCEGFSTRIDAEAAGDRDGAVRELVRALVSAVRRLRGAATEEGDGGADHGGAPAAPGGEVTRVLVRARDGALAVTRDGREIVALSPASVSLEVAGSRLRSAELSLGDARSGPAIELHVTARERDGYRVDLEADALPLSELARWLPAVPWHDAERGRAHARVRAEPGARPGVFAVDGEVALSDFGLRHPGLSREPISGLSASVRGTAEVDLARRRVATEGLTLALNGISAAVAGWLERDGARTVLDASVRLPTMSCDAIRRALPPAVTGPVNDLTFAGTLGADVRFALDTANLAATVLDVRADERCTLARDGLRQGVRRLGGPFVQRVQEPTGLRAFVTGPGSAAWVPLRRVSPHVVNAVLTREDGGFFRHRGFNVNEIRAAIVRDLAARRFVYGASTITMQLAKNIFLAREKTLVRKLQEVALTWYLERTLGKEAILEMYLNVVEFGPGIYGIGPAARFFFGREPAELSPVQAIYLATLLPSPVVRFANYQRGAVSAETAARVRGVARTMAARGLLTAAEAAAAQQEPIVFRPPSTRPPGPLTQTVDPDTTDAMAEAMSPGLRGDDDDEGATATAAEEPAGVGDEPEAPPAPAARSVVPVSVRTGGAI